MLLVAVGIVLIIVVGILRPSKGKIGERKVSNKLDWLPRNKYIVINDVILPTPHGTADIKMDIKESHVVYWSQLRRCIRRYNKERHTWKEVKAICNRIYEVKLKPSRRTQRRHMTGVRSAQIHRERAIKEGRCPRCGGILVERDGQFGRFYGCSNYPRCRFILK